MSTAPLDEEKMKSLVKAALIEVLEERGDLVREAIEDAVEDYALARAIEEATRSGEESDQAFLSERGLAEAYGPDEPEYSLDLIKEPNPEYERR
jgi:predicted DNA-binding protein